MNTKEYINYVPYSKFQETLDRVHKSQWNVHDSSSVWAHRSLTSRGRYMSISNANKSLARISKFEDQTKDVLGDLYERHKVQSDIVEARLVKALEQLSMKLSINVL